MMMNPNSKSAPVQEQEQEANDIFSISDQVLADRLQFIEEVRLSLSASTSPTLNCYVGLMMLTGEMAIDWLWQLGKRLGLPSQTQSHLRLLLARTEWRDDDCGQAGA